MLDMVDVVVLVSGDGDFVPLADFIRSRGRIVHIASFRESTSTMLVEASDIYTNLSDDKRKFLIPERKVSANKTKKTTKKSDSTSRTIKTGKAKKSLEEIEESRSRRLSL